jgi:hypothetical protein
MSPAYSFRKKDAPAKKHPKPTYPPDHKAAMRVPKGGSSCMKCKFLGEDEKSCTSSYFLAWNGSKILPAPADVFCSDWFESK